MNWNVIVPVLLAWFCVAVIVSLVVGALIKGRGK